MVGWLGGCCCGGGTPPPPFCDSGFNESLTEDFSPDFDPYLSKIGEVVATAGVMRATGNWFFYSSSITGGFVYGAFQKTSLDSTFTISLKLIDWQTLMTPFTQYSVQLLIIPPGGRCYGLEAYNAGGAPGVPALNRYQVMLNGAGSLPGVGPARIVLSNEPQDGDTMSVDFLNWTTSGIVTPGGARPQQIDFKVNGVVVHSITTVTETFQPCDIDVLVYLWQPAFPSGVISPGNTIVKLDDFTVSQS